MNGPSETKPNPENCKNCSSKCAYDCAQLQYTIQHRTVLIISPLTSRQPWGQGTNIQGIRCSSTAFCYVYPMVNCANIGLMTTNLRTLQNMTKAAAGANWNVWDHSSEFRECALCFPNGALIRAPSAKAFRCILWSGNVLVWMILVLFRTYRVNIKK